jgi:hypothetical protein
VPNRVILPPNVGTDRTAVGLVDVGGEVATPAAGREPRFTPYSAPGGQHGACGFAMWIGMLSLVYEGSRDEAIYDRLSERMRDRFDIFGQLPDTLEDDWIG